MSRRTAESARWLRRHPGGAAPRLRLVCLPHAGGAASAFRQWRGLLPDDIELLCVQYPGRQDRFDEPAIDSMAAMVDRLSPLVGDECDRPVALFGHSMGGAIAYEVARRLEVTRRTVVHTLFVSGRAAPHLVAETAAYAGGDGSLIAAVRRLDKTNWALFAHPELGEMLLPPLRADYRLIETYRVDHRGPAVSAPVVAYTGDDDPVCDARGARAWAEYTTGPFACAVFPGDHFFLVPNERRMLADMVARLVSPTGQTAGPAAGAEGRDGLSGGSPRGAAR